MKIKYFTESAYNTLFDSISSNLSLYKSSDGSWIKKSFKNQDYFKESRIDLHLPELTASNNKAEEDYSNALLIHSAFRDRITPKQASNVFLWSYLSHCEYWKYTSKRWANEKMSIDTVKQRFFCYTETGSRIGFVRNSISRLWWGAYLTYQEDKPAPYELTKVLFSHSDIFLQVIERNFSMNREVIIGILSAIKAINDDPKLDDVGVSKVTGEYEWRTLCKYLNRYGAVTLLDALDREDIYNLSYEYILRKRKQIL